MISKLPSNTSADDNTRINLVFYQQYAIRLYSINHRIVNTAWIHTTKDMLTGKQQSHVQAMEQRENPPRETWSEFRARVCNVCQYSDATSCWVLRQLGNKVELAKFGHMWDDNPHKIWTAYIRGNRIGQFSESQEFRFSKKSEKSEK